jgi:dolichol-phosphate mannosyltransferase
MPLELWVQAAHRNLKIREVAVPLIYLDEKRSFGGALDDAERRLTHYREVIEKALTATKFVPTLLPPLAMPCHEPAETC